MVKTKHPGKSGGWPLCHLFNDIEATKEPVTFDPRWTLVSICMYPYLSFSGSQHHVLPATGISLSFFTMWRLALTHKDDAEAQESRRTTRRGAATLAKSSIIYVLHGVSWKPVFYDLPMVFLISGPKSTVLISFFRFWHKMLNWDGCRQRKHTFATRRIWWSMLEAQNVGSRILGTKSRIGFYFLGRMVSDKIITCFYVETKVLLPMTVWTVGSFHGFGEKVSLTLQLPVRSRFCRVYPISCFSW